MIICKVWDAEYPWDVRVEKVSAALRDAGHRVHLVARNRDGRALREDHDGITIHRLAPLPRLGHAVNAASMFPAFLNPRWFRRIRQVAADTGAELILCRDLPLAPTSLWVGRRLGVPVVVDMAEDYPALLAQLYNRRDFRLHNLLIRNPLLAAMVERYVVKRVDGIVVVTREASDRLAAAGPDRLVVVGNTPTPARVAALADRAPPRRPGPDLRLVYLGLLETTRGVELVLQAAARATEPRLSVDFFGADPGDRWRRRAAALGLEGQTVFHGYVGYDEALARLPEYDVGVMPHHLSRHIQTTLPNKVYDYMAAGLPVLSSDAGPVRRLLEAERCGLVFRDRDVSDFLAQCSRLADPVVRGEMGAAGRRAVSERHNWGLDGARLVAFVERIRAGARTG